MNPSLRGAAFLAGWIVGPLCLGLAASAVRLSVVAAVLFYFWFGLVFPHPNVSTGSVAPTAREVWSLGTASLLAIAQWIAVAALYGYGVRNQSGRLQFWLAPAVVVAVGIAVNALIISMGYSINSGP